MNIREKSYGKDNSTSEYVVLDLETTSLNIYTCEIIEIAALKIRNGQEVSEFCELIKPKKPIPSEITSITGIDNNMVCNSRTIFEVLPEFLEFIGDNILIGHNIGSYDLNILYDALRDYMKTELNNIYIDTLSMSRARIHDIQNHKLGTLCQYFNINSSNAHRALADCYMTNECFKQLCYIQSVEDDEYNIIEKRTKTYSINFTDESKGLQTLQGFLLGIVADDVITESELEKLSIWMVENQHLGGNYPYDRIINSIERVLQDGIIEQSELNYLLDLYKSYASPVGACKSIEEKHELCGKSVCLSGDFEIGPKAYVANALEKMGATIDSTVKKTTEIVLVGSLGSINWKCSNYGSKIKKALEMQEKGIGIKIVTESEVIEILKVKQ